MDWLSVCCFLAALACLEGAWTYRGMVFTRFKTWWGSTFGRLFAFLFVLGYLVVGLGLTLKGCNVTWTQVTSFLASL